MDEGKFNNFLEELGIALENSCGELVDTVKSLTPVDTQRLYESTRTMELTKENDLLKCGVVIGGIELFGVTREQDIKKMVDYALYVEYSQFYIQGNLGLIIDKLLLSLRMNLMIALTGFFDNANF